jgi:hypothetical protein
MNDAEETGISFSEVMQLLKMLSHRGTSAARQVYPYPVHTQNRQEELVTRAVALFPGTRVDGVVLPFLTTAYEVHDEAEDEHEESPDEIDVDVKGLLIDGAVARDEAKDAEDGSGDEEDKSEGNADV